jgi:hypothetical protein
MIITLTDDQWTNLGSVFYTTFLRSYANNAIQVAVSVAAPIGEQSYVFPNESVLINNSKVNVWVKGKYGNKLVYGDQDVDLIKPYQMVDLPSELYTDTNSDVAGAKRLRVDVGQTSFFAGREFRTYKELNIANGATYVIKSVVPKNIILLGLQLVIDDGWVRLSTHAGGTEGGTYSETLPLIRANTMIGTPVITPATVLTAGGTQSGGTELDVIRLKTVNGTGSAISVGSISASERGIAPGTYYFKFQNLGTGAIQGMFNARFEERAT